MSVVSRARTLVTDKQLQVQDTCTLLELLKKVADDRAEIDTREAPAEVVSFSEKKPRVGGEQ